MPYAHGERPHGPSRGEDRAGGPGAPIAWLHRAAGNEAVSRLLSEAAQPPPVTVQRVVYGSMAAMWQGVAPDYDPRLIARIIGADPALAALYGDAERQLPVSDFQQVAGMRGPVVDPPLPAQPGLYRVRHPPAAAVADTHYFVAAILHELGHVAMARTYRTNRAAEEIDFALWAANAHLPRAALGSDGASAQQSSLDRQLKVIEDNWSGLRAVFKDERGAFTDKQAEHIVERIDYADSSPHWHNETVLGDLMYWLAANGHAGTGTYRFAARMLREANDRRARPGTDARVVDRNAWWFQFWKW